jgi:hypothetical protein|nr:MAG TPA: hypothetical protein [Microviridae sp.]
MVLLSDFLKSFESSSDSEIFRVSDVFQRLNFYHLFDGKEQGEKDYVFTPLDFVGFTQLSCVYYFFRFRGSISGYLLNYSEKELPFSGVLYCRPKRAWRDWFENVLLPH